MNNIPEANVIKLYKESFDSSLLVNCSKNVVDVVCVVVVVVFFEAVVLGVILDEKSPEIGSKEVPKSVGSREAVLLSVVDSSNVELVESEKDSDVESEKDSEVESEKDSEVESENDSDSVLDETSFVILEKKSVDSA